MTTTGAGRLIDQGYRPYDGPRGGRAQAVRSVTRTTLWRALGIHRPARAKVFPVVAIVLAYVPTAVYVGVAVIGNHLEREGGPGRAFAGAFIPSYASNEVQVVLAVLVVACFVAPEVLCPDRRNGMLGLYLASPLDRFTYLWAKAQAILIVVAVVTIGPSLILLIGYSTQGYGPDGVAEWFATFGRIIGAGLADLAPLHGDLAGDLVDHVSQGGRIGSVPRRRHRVVRAGDVPGRGRWSEPLLRPVRPRARCPTRRCSGSSTSPRRWQRVSGGSPTRRSSSATRHGSSWVSA